MAGGEKRATGEGEEVHEAARRTQQRATRTSMGEGGKEIYVSGTQGQRDAGGSFRRKKPTDHLPLHAGPGMEGRVSQLFVAGRPFQSLGCSPGAEGRDIRGGFAGATD